MPEPAAAPYDSGDAPTGRTYRPVPTYADRMTAATSLPTLTPASRPYDGCESCTSGTITLPLRMLDTLNRRIAELDEALTRAERQRDEARDEITELLHRAEQAERDRDWAQARVDGQAWEDAEREMARTIAAQAEQLQRNGTLLCVVKDALEMIDRARAAHDTASPPATAAAEPRNSPPEGDGEGGPATEAHSAAEAWDPLADGWPWQGDGWQPPAPAAPGVVDELDAARRIATAPDPATPAGNQPARRAVVALAAARTALEHAPRTCYYHGSDFDETDLWMGLPRCESCQQPYRVTRALAAIDAAGREG